ncbi:MAG: hypothetical protein WDZ30_07135 [Cellvibrionaceae bacterium]
MADQFQLVSKGMPLDGYLAGDVKERLSRYIKNPGAINKLLSGREIVVKKSLAHETLVQQANLLQQCGLSVEVIAAPDAKEAAPPRPAQVKTLDAPEDRSGDTKPGRGRVPRLKYAFDTFMAGGSSAMFKALVVVFVASFLALGLLRAVFFVFFPDLALQNETGFWGNLYTTYLQLTDPGNMAQDIFSSGWYKFFAVAAGIVGVIIFSSLIAFITSALEQKMRDLRQGRSKVIEDGHTLILGWNEERIVEVLRELVTANESEDYACVVILADQDKEHMDQAIRLQVAATLSTRIVTRRGKVTLHSNLDTVALERSKSVIILAECKDTDGTDAKMASDASVIQTILAVTGKLNGQTVVAELFDTTYREIVESTLSDNVVIVNTNEILAKLLVQTSRSVGLSVVYNEILSFDGCEIYFHEDDWPDTPFSDLVFHFEDGVPLGYKSSDGEIHLNPPRDYRLQSTDEVIILADDDSTIELQSEPIAAAEASPLPDRRLEKISESELLIGWNQKSSIVIREFAEYITDGRIDVLLKSPDDEIREAIRLLDQELDNVQVSLIEKDYLNRNDLLSIRPFDYDNIIIFASQRESCDAQQVDSENIVCLLVLRHIFQGHEEATRTKLITEVMDSQNQSLVSSAGVKDIIISTRLLSMVMAQISENQHIKRVYDDIFEEDGSEIYLKPVDLYFETIPPHVSFAQLIKQAQQRGEVCIGVKIASQEADAASNFGVQLIPDKNSHFELGQDDLLVVLAEDEL